MYCSPPTVPTELKLESGDICYLFRALDQCNSDFAILWLEKWKNNCPSLEDKLSSVIFKSVVHHIEPVIAYLLSEGMVTQSMVDFQVAECQRLQAF